MAWDFTNDKPIYLQIVEKLSADIVSGRYAPGDRIPSVRDIAVDAAVNPNTVQKALSELERSAIIVTKRNSGKFVTEDENIMEVFRFKQARSVTLELVARMLKMGYSPEDIRNAVARAIDEIAASEGGIE